VARRTRSERIIFWGALFPASLVIDVWCLVVLYIGWGWLTQ